MKLKKILFLCMILLLSFGLIACGKNKTELTEDEIKNISKEILEDAFSDVEDYLDKDNNVESNNSNESEFTQTKTDVIEPTSTPIPTPTPTPIVEKLSKAEEIVKGFIESCINGSYNEALTYLECGADSPFVTEDNLSYWLPRNKFYFISDWVIDNITYDGVRDGSTEEVTASDGVNSILFNCYLNDENNWVIQLKDFYVSDVSFKSGFENVKINGIDISDYCVGAAEIKTTNALNSKKYVVPYMFKGKHEVNITFSDETVYTYDETVEEDNQDVLIVIQHDPALPIVQEKIQLLIDWYNNLYADYKSQMSKEDIVNKYFDTRIDTDLMYDYVVEGFDSSFKYRMEKLTLYTEENGIYNYLFQYSEDTYRLTVNFFRGVHSLSNWKTKSDWSQVAFNIDEEGLVKVQDDNGGRYLKHKNSYWD